MAYKLKYGQQADFQEGDRVRIVVRSELHKAPNESELAYEGCITEIDDSGFWYRDDEDLEREEYLAFEEVEGVFVR